MSGSACSAATAGASVSGWAASTSARCARISTDEAGGMSASRRTATSDAVAGGGAAWSIITSTSSSALGPHPAAPSVVTGGWSPARASAKSVRKVPGPASARSGSGVTVCSAVSPSPAAATAVKGPSQRRSQGMTLACRR